MGILEKFGVYIVLHSYILYLRYRCLSGNIKTIDMTVNYNLVGQLSIYLNLGQFDQTKSLIRCTNRCLLRTDCRSLFYQNQTKQCILHSLNILELSVQGIEVDLVTSAGWKYYEREEGTYFFLFYCLLSILNITRFTYIVLFIYPLVYSPHFIPFEVA